MNNIITINRLLHKLDGKAAEDYCNSAIKTNKQDPELYNLLGLAFVLQKKFRDAISAFARACTLNDNVAMYHHHLSLAYNNIGNTAQALRHGLQALKIDRSLLAAITNVGNIYYKQGDFTEAENYYRRAIFLDSNSVDAIVNLANLLVKADKAKESIEFFEKSLKLQPKNKVVINNLGLLYFSEAEYAKACPLLEQAHNNSPNDGKLTINLAETLLHLGNYTKAQEYFLKALKLEPKESSIYHNLAILFLKQDKKADAKEHFTKSLELNPNNQAAKHMLNALTDKAATTAPEMHIKQLFDQYANYYNQHMQQQLKYQVPTVLRNLVAKNFNLAKAVNILDLGCGTGLCGPVFRDMANVLVGLDLSSNMLRHAKQLGIYDYLLQGDINNYWPGYNQNYFDGIIAADSLCYLGCLEQIFAMVSTTLSNKGFWVFSVEESKDKDYKLQESGRFAHSKDYIQKLTKVHNFILMELNDIDLTRNTGINTPGFVALISR